MTITLALFFFFFFLSKNNKKKKKKKKTITDNISESTFSGRPGDENTQFGLTSWFNFIEYSLLETVILSVIWCTLIGGLPTCSFVSLVFRVLVLCFFSSSYPCFTCLLLLICEPCLCEYSCGSKRFLLRAGGVHFFFYCCFSVSRPPF